MRKLAVEYVCPENKEHKIAHYCIDCDSEFGLDPELIKKDSAAYHIGWAIKNIEQEAYHCAKDRMWKALECVWAANSQKDRA